MNRAIYILGVLLGLFFASSCNREEAKNAHFKLDTRVAIPWDGAALGRINSIKQDGHSALGMMDWSDTSYHIRKSDQPELLTQKLDLRAFVQATQLPATRGLWEFDAAGQLYCFFSEYRLLYALTDSGTIQKQWDLSTVISESEKPYYVQAVPGASFKVEGNQLYILAVRFDLQFPQTASSRKSFFKDEPTVLHITLEDSIPAIKAYWGQYSSQTLKHGYNFLNPYPHWCMSPNHELVTAFNGDQETLVFQEQLLKSRKTTSSQHIQKINPFPDDSAGNFVAMKEYWAVEPAYRDIIYDPYNNCYYRVASHRMAYRNASGLLNKMEHKTWSLIILDEALNKIGEHSFDPKLYSDLFIVPTEEGTLIGTNREPDEVGRLILTRFNLIR